MCARCWSLQGVEDAGDVAEDGQQDADEELGAAAGLEEDAEGREQDGEDDLDDVAVWGFLVSPVGVFFLSRGMGGGGVRDGKGCGLFSGETNLPVKGMLGEW